MDIMANPVFSPEDVLDRIDQITESLIDHLDQLQDPVLTTHTTNSSTNAKTTTVRSMDNLNQCRLYTSILLVLSFVQKLLRSNRTTTNREVYYFFITHFRSQRECDAAIVDVCNLLGVERIALGLSASPKGWFCGNIQIIHQDAASSSITTTTRTKSGANDFENDNYFLHSSHPQDPLPISATTTTTTTTTTINGTSLSSIQGLPITREWLLRATVLQQQQQKQRQRHTSHGNSQDTHFQKKDQDSMNNINDYQDGNDNDTESAKSTTNEMVPQAFEIKSDAKCILVIEKEGVYTRLSEDRFFERYPCILITGKGNPDLNTRAMVHVLHHELQIPVYGICDCNPYGVGILQTYIYGSERREMDGRDRYHVPIQWVGLRPSHIEELKKDLPPEVFQSLTDLDKRKLEKLCHETSIFINQVPDVDGDAEERKDDRRKELQEMMQCGYKVELEALHWLGMDFMCDWLDDLLWDNEQDSSLII